VFFDHQAERFPCTLRHRYGILDQSLGNGLVERQAPPVLSGQGRHELHSCFEAQSPGELAQCPEVRDLAAGFVCRNCRLRGSGEFGKSALRDSGAPAKEQHFVHVSNYIQIDILRQPQTLTVETLSNPDDNHVGNPVLFKAIGQSEQGLRNSEKSCSQSLEGGHLFGKGIRNRQQSGYQPLYLSQPAVVPAFLSLSYIRNPRGLSARRSIETAC